MAQSRQSNEGFREQAGRAGGRAPVPINMASIAMRGIGQMCDMQAAVTRMMLQTQARTASAFGLPDWSQMFRVGDDRARRVFSDSTEYLVHTAQQANDTVGEVHREIGRLWEFQAVSFAENLQRGLQELQAQTEESLDQLRALTQQQVDEMAQATRSLSERARETMREGNEQIRETVRQGFERGRELAGEQSEAIRGAGERMAEDATQGERGARRGKAA